MTDKDRAKEVCQRYDRLWATQGNWRDIWQDCASYVSPRKGNIEEERSSGERQTDEVYDTTATEAANIFAAGMISQLTPAGEIWARYTPKGDAPEDVKAWLDECSQIAMKVIHASNFYLGYHEDSLDSGIFGSSLLFVDEDEEDLINTTNVPVGKFVWEENHRGEIDTVIRSFEFTARQCEQRFGEEYLPDSVKDCLKGGGNSEGKMFEILHQVRPRAKNVMKGMVVPELRPIESLYVIKEGTCLVQEGGYYDMPFMGGRLLKSNGELYGRGPATQVMPEIKTVNRMERDLLIASEKMVNPPWLMPDDGAYQPDNRAGGVTYYDALTPNAKPEQMQLSHRVDIGEAKADQKRRRINEAFHVPMFQMLTNMQEQRREKTAFEVAEMMQEKLLMFSPIFARNVEEKLTPFMERVFGICLRAGRFPQPPQSVIDAGGALEYQLEYVSKIALAIRAALTDSIGTIIQLIEMASQFDPSVVHVVAWRDAVRQFLENKGFPSQLVRNDEQVDQIMAQIAQAQNEAAAPEQAQQMAKAVKDLGPDAQAAAVEAVAAG